MDRTGSGSCSTVGFVISGDETLCSAAREKDGSREIGFENGRCTELAQDRVQWQVLVLAVWKFCVLLLER